ncbi:MAG: LysM peptidoglycan-binding domain-containing protein, partial [Candidatus Nanopelagicales bacterium]
KPTKFEQMFQTPVRVESGFVRPLCYISTSVRTKRGIRTMQTAAALSQPIRLTRKGRLAITSLAGLVLLAGLFTLATSGAEASNTSSSASVIEVVVSPGDTLWSIAKAVKPNQDPRETIYDIKAMNLISGSQVFPGQIIKVPAN